MADRPADLMNRARLDKLMDESGLHAVVVRSGMNVTYLSGVTYPGTLARHLDLVDSPRGIFVVWPRSGEPAIIVNGLAAEVTERDSWITRIEVYQGYTEPPISRVIAVLGSMGLADARVGFERSAINAVDWAHVELAFPTMRIEDCTRVLDRVRAIKTPGEVALLREAADLLDEAYLEVFPTIRPGEPESAVHARILEACIRRGAGWGHGILHSHRNNVVYGGESAVPFAAGDVIRTDYVVYLRGYPGHQSRNVILGEPTPEQRAQYRQARELYADVIDMCRPGAVAGAIHDEIAKRFAAIGAGPAPMLSGHSVGAWWHQQAPFIARGDTTALEAGMVLALEPYIGHWHIQDMVLVTDGAPELISARFPTDEPFVVRI